MNRNIDKLVEEALNSADGITRAAPPPFLHTRITGRMQRGADNRWEKVVRLLTRPAVALAMLCLVIAANLAAVLLTDNIPAATEEQTAAADDLSDTVAGLYDIDNNEP